MTHRVTRTPATSRKPAWLKVRIGCGPDYARVKGIVEKSNLHTVCQEALCPNMGECWQKGHATILILGGVCTRGCRFCNVTPGHPGAADTGEPRRVAAGVRDMGLRNIVITSVTRDDLPDGGAAIWAETIRTLRDTVPSARIEVLVPDFAGSGKALDTVLAARPDVVGHNLETVPSLYRRLRSRANYRRSLKLLRAAHRKGFITKTALMLGLGETRAQVLAVMRAARRAGCDILYLGQYLRPTARHAAVRRYVTPAEFGELAEVGRALGFAVVVAGPLVRSSYCSAEQDRFVGQRLSSHRQPSARSA